MNLIVWCILNINIGIHIAMVKVYQQKLQANHIEKLFGKNGGTYQPCAQLLLQQIKLYVCIFLL